MKLKYWTGFTKRKNSTKVPTGTGTEVDVYLKENTSIDNPTVILKGNAINIDYAYIQTFGKYYFVGAPVMLTNGTTQYDLEEDVLATHKTEVGNTIAHIVYSSTGYDTNIIDTRMTVKTSKNVYGHTGTFSITAGGVSVNVMSSAGCFVLSVANTKSSGNGFVSSYIVDGTTLVKCAQFLMALDFTDPQTQLIKSVFKPYDTIISCTWIPIEYTVASTMGSGEYIVFGDYEASAQNIIGYKLTGTPRLTGSDTITIHPQRTDFRSVQPYTTYSLFIPMYGCVDLNASDLQMATLESLPYTWSIDLASGDMSLLLYQGTPHIQTFNFNIGVNCPIAQTSVNMTGSVSSIGGIAGGIMGIAMASTGLGAAAGVASVLGSAASLALNGNARSTSIKGGINGRAAVAMGTSLIVNEYVFDTEDPDDTNYIAKWGRPVGLTHAINNHSGYVQCENASVEIAGDNSERDSINAYLNSGFYYE